MDMKNTVSLRSCIAVHSRAAGRNIQNFNTGSLPNIASPRRSTTSSDYVPDVLNKNNFNQKSTSSTVADRNNINNKDATQKEISISSDQITCFQCECVTLDDMTNYVIQELKNELQDLTLEIIKEKNEGQLHKRDIRVAKKVIEKEIAADTYDFETLLEKANNMSWKGRQEIILSLKRKLRRLNEVLDHLHGKTAKERCIKNIKPKKEDSINIITDDQKMYWCLELQRRDIWKNVERYQQDIFTSKDFMRKKLDLWKKRNEVLEKEIRSIREKLSTIPKQVDKGIIKQLYDTKIQLKAEFEEKSEDKRLLDILQQEFPQSNKIKEDLKITLAVEKRALKEKEEKLKSLRENSTKLQFKSEEIKEKKCKQAMIVKKKLEDIQCEYVKFTGLTENFLEELVNSKNLLEGIKKLQQKKSFYNIIRKSFSSVAINMRRERPIIQLDQIEFSNEIENLKAYVYENKLLKYMSISQILDSRNEDKLENLSILINQTNESIFEFLKNQYLDWKLAMDIRILKSRKMKLKKYVTHPVKQKLIKKKNSSLKMVNLDDRKIYLAVLKEENKCLKSLIKCVLASKQDDFDLVQIFLTRNKDVFLGNFRST